MNKQQRIDQIKQKDRVVGFYLEKHESTRGDVTAYQLGVLVYTTAWDEEAGAWAKEFTERKTLYLNVINEGRVDAQNNSIEEAHWEAKNMEHTEWPDRSRSAFEQAVESKLADLEANGTFIAIVNKILYKKTNTVVVHAVVPDGANASKEVLRAAQWNEQADSWTLYSHTKLN